jgi:hypothetical protein
MSGTHRRGMLSHVFDDKHVRLIPFQPILFACLFLGTLLGMLTALPEELNYPLYLIWLLGSLVALPTYFVSLWMIVARPGQPRYVGYWLRFIADVAQGASMVCFIIWGTQLARGLPEIPFITVYLSWILFAVVIFMALLVVRDVYRLIMEGRLAKEDRGV